MKILITDESGNGYKMTINDADGKSHNACELLGVLELAVLMVKKSLISGPEIKETSDNENI